MTCAVVAVEQSAGRDTDERGRSSSVGDSCVLPPAVSRYVFRGQYRLANSTDSVGLLAVVAKNADFPVSTVTLP